VSGVGGGRGRPFFVTKQLDSQPKRNYNTSMINNEFAYKEHVIFFMMTTSISLSHYDYKFISNMQSLTHDKKQITSGQADLFDRLLAKYRKQFATNGYDPVNLIELPWKCLVVTSLPKYTNANVDWDESINKLVIRVPFKKEFISSFRKEMTNIFPVNDTMDSTEAWLWNNERKRYESNPTAYALKLAYDILPKFFTTVYHNEVKDIITELESKTVEYRDPTLIVKDGNYSVVNSNNVLDELLKDCNLDNTPNCLYLMSKLGIKVDESITQGDPELLFASSYIVECDIDEIDNWCSWLKTLGVENILLGRGSPAPLKGARSVRSGGHGVYRECYDTLSMNKFSIHMQKDLFWKEMDEAPGLPVLIQFNSIVEPEQCHGDNCNGKILIITNRRTIEIS